MASVNDLISNYNLPSYGVTSGAPAPSSSPTLANATSALKQAYAQKTAPTLLGGGKITVSSPEELAAVNSAPDDEDAAQQASLFNNQVKAASTLFDSTTGVDSQVRAALNPVQPQAQPVAQGTALVDTSAMENALAPYINAGARGMYNAMGLMHSAVSDNGATAPARPYDPFTAAFPSLLSQVTAMANTDPSKATDWGDYFTGMAKMKTGQRALSAMANTAGQAAANAATNTQNLTQANQVATANQQLAATNSLLGYVPSGINSQMGVMSMPARIAQYQAEAEKNRAETQKTLLENQGTLLANNLKAVIAPRALAEANQVGSTFPLFQALGTFANANVPQPNVVNTPTTTPSITYINGRPVAAGGLEDQTRQLVAPLVPQGQAGTVQLGGKTLVVPGNPNPSLISGAALQ